MHVTMPRTARIDTPGLLHHVMIRGIERRKIFNDVKDRENIIERLSVLLPETKTQCYAWSFLSNHAHFLFRSGPHGIAGLMRRLLTGYVVSYNKRHRRHGQLFQNRYKLLAVIYNDPVADNKTDPPQTINFYKQHNKYWYYN
jgi:putative transposase